MLRRLDKPHQRSHSEIYLRLTLRFCRRTTHAVLRFQRSLGAVSWWERPPVSSCGRSPDDCWDHRRSRSGDRSHKRSPTECSHTLLRTCQSALTSNRIVQSTFTRRLNTESANFIGSIFGCVIIVQSKLVSVFGGILEPQFQTYQIGKRSGVGLVHNLTAMNFHGALTDTEFNGDDLVRLA